jgi:hypothetical protein
MACVKKLYSDESEFSLTTGIENAFYNFDEGKVNIEDLYNNIIKFLKEEQQVFFFGDINPD